MIKVTVIPVTEPPLLPHPEIVSGIRDASQAREWGEKNGFGTVWFLMKRQRAYGDKSSKMVLGAKTMEQKSKELLKFSEQGGAWVENAVLVGIALGLLWLLGRLVGLPW